MENNPFFDITSIEQFSRTDIESVLSLARQYLTNGIPNTVLAGKVIGSLFFEPSTRTRLSFATAIHRLGGSVVGFDTAESTSIAKGESLSDTIRMVDGYVDAIVIRHPDAGSASIAAEVAKHPVVNAGDGAHQHPTQSLLDLFTIQHAQGTLDGLTVAFVGDLKYGRVPHSAAKALAQFPTTRQIWIAPESLQMPEDVHTYVTERGVDVVQTADLATTIPQVDILYMTRVQIERFADPAEYERLKDVYILKPEMLASAKQHMRILHALPRRYEIPEEIDRSPHAYYFEQASFGVPVRAALLSLIINSKR